MFQSADRPVGPIFERGTQPSRSVFLEIACDGVGILANRPSDDPVIDSCVMHAQNQSLHLELLHHIRAIQSFRDVSDFRVCERELAHDSRYTVMLLQRELFSDVPRRNPLGHFHNL